MSVKRSRICTSLWFALFQSKFDRYWWLFLILYFPSDCLWFLNWAYPFWILLILINGHYQIRLHHGLSYRSTLLCLAHHFGSLLFDGHHLLFDTVMQSSPFWIALTSGRHQSVHSSFLHQVFTYRTRR
jgi:hypothetical protein